MPFVMSSVLLFLRGIDSKRKLYSAIQLIMSGFLVFIGYKIKGSVIILIPDKTDIITHPAKNNEN